MKDLQKTENKLVCSVIIATISGIRALTLHWSLHYYPKIASKEIDKINESPNVYYNLWSLVIYNISVIIIFSMAIEKNNSGLCMSQKMAIDKFLFNN